MNSIYNVKFNVEIFSYKIAKEKPLKNILLIMLSWWLI